MKFILPSTIIKVTKQEHATLDLGKEIYPIGTLYKVVATGLYFRFLKLGNRWEPEYGISTADGVLYRKLGSSIGEIHPIPYSLPVWTCTHKIDVVNGLLKTLNLLT